MVSEVLSMDQSYIGIVNNELCYPFSGPVASGGGNRLLFRIVVIVALLGNKTEHVRTNKMRPYTRRYVKAVVGSMARSYVAGRLLSTSTSPSKRKNTSRVTFARCSCPTRHVAKFKVIGSRSTSGNVKRYFTTNDSGWLTGGRTVPRHG